MSSELELACQGKETYVCRPPRAWHLPAFLQHDDLFESPTDEATKVAGIGTKI